MNIFKQIVDAWMGVYLFFNTRFVEYDFNPWIVMSGKHKKKREQRRKKERE
jgi:anionic cell wall polymer biosynthesis LytR-Cps2A-Psr (LCP) family protein